MTDETLEKVIDLADSKGFYRERANFLEGILYTLIDCSKLAYSGETLSISDEAFTAILRTFDSEAVGTAIGVLKEVRENDG